MTFLRCGNIYLHAQAVLRTRNRKNYVEQMLEEARFTSKVVPGKKKARLIAGLYGYGRRPTLPGVTPVPSARQGLTSLFGMGRGGAPALGRPMSLSAAYRY